MEQLSITNHAMERYAKRIANRETTIDVNTYVQLNKDKITEDINTMIHFGNRIYTGRVGQREERPVNVYLSGTWVILTDILDKTVITVYKVNLGLDEEFNKTFINGILKRMQEHKAELAEAQKQTEEEKKSYQSIIADNNAQINEYKAAINELEKLNTDYQETIGDIGARHKAAELAVKRDVENLIMRMEF